MERARQSPWRVPRAVVFAGSSALLATAGHQAAGGGLPDPAVTVVVGAALVPMAVGLADRRRSALSVTGALLAAQVLFHLLFSASAHHGSGDGWPSGRMVVFHLLAALLTGLVLTAADRAAGRVGRRRLVLSAGVAAGPIAILSWFVRTTAVPGPALARLVSGPAVRRGPPRVSLLP
ncbi:hypothetical protein GIS00_17270 [Nakamurella sp. YIM 132087]|uniref:Uncharacterized protein n=1 Tax=Nakamurella alba TaxID=2665158 RepID=A0A7K1FNE0_9ACTN|nr:hypothetical protein [Nakamurella alba]MTD15687.1 hypothetical protein [Nakamurella alba]